jgi:antitoxin MazE2
MGTCVGPSRVRVIHVKLACMTMLSFRVPDDEAAEVQRWAKALGVDRSEILRDALHRHLVALSAEHDADAWERAPLNEAERSLSEIADWGPAEDWADWHDAAR